MTPNRLRAFGSFLLLAFGIAALPAHAADKSILPSNKPAPSLPAEKPEASGLTNAAANQHDHSPYDKVREVFSGDLTIAGEKVVFPQQNPSVRAIVVTMDPGERTVWHQHGAPLFAYILEGEVTVTYDGIGKKLLREGEGLLEAMTVTHQGENTGQGPAKILAVFLLGDDGEPVTEEAPPGAEQKKIQ
ncbi:cupin domain-containing protein [Roseibium sp. HPY-6]|uniref:cupin domain-containing protein n=1 Tax=Roseibium sp. HPY-6 TaxID=3229852 RepID=UPI00338EAF35